MSGHTATQLLYAAAGRPDVDAEPCAGACWLCGGEMTAGKPATLPPTFMDYDKARCPESGYICDACWFSMAEQSELLAERVGKDRPQRMRNYSHFVLDGQWYPLSKGDKRAMCNLLEQAPELAVIAVSGQKHLVFRAQPGRWQVEEQAVLPDVDRLGAMMAQVQTLYDGGFSKGEIESGHYTSRRIMAYGVERWESVERVIRHWRGSATFELAVFLCQKSEGEDGQGEDGGGVCGDRLGAVAGDGCQLQAPLCAGDLGPVSGPAAGRGDGDQQPGAVSQLVLL